MQNILSADQAEREYIVKIIDHQAILWSQASRVVFFYCVILSEWNIIKYVSYKY